MTSKKPPLQFNRAVQLIADGRMSVTTVARTLGVSESALRKWMTKPEFRVQQRAMVDQIRESADAVIANKAQRIRVLQEMHSRMLEIVDERSEKETRMEEANGQSIPGAKSGLIIRRLVLDRDGGEHLEYEFDRAMVSEFRAIHEQVAKELGQTVEKHEHKISSLRDLSDEQLQAFAAELGGEPEN